MKKKFYEEQLKSTKEYKVKASKKMLKFRIFLKL